ncbi:MAG: Holliday junction branch migration protein RuvA [Bacteroidota bacterium]
MYDHFDGKLVEKNPAYVVIECAGVGYLLNISLNTFSKIGNEERCRLFAHLAVREDAHVLYGFHDTAERELFLKLISVSGVGAATARMILSSLSPDEIRSAIAAGNVALLKGVKGIGEKTAQRIIVDLAGKLAKDDVPRNFLAAHNKIKEEALLALVSLGFARNMAEKALEKAVKSDPADKTVEQLIKDALRNL